MRSLTRGVFSLVVAAALVLGACSKSVEGESKRWTSNTAKVTELGAQYPGFKPALEARKTSAQAIFDEAAKMDGAPSRQLRCTPGDRPR